MNKLSVMAFLVFGLFAFTACGNNGAVQNPSATPSANAPNITENYAAALTIEELGETIAAAGAFWEDWWSLSGRFDFEQHFELFEWEYLPDHYATFSPEHNAWLERREALMEEYLTRFPQHILEMGAFDILLPSSGFSNLNDIRSYLLQYYTESWVDAQISSEFPTFVEYDGALFVNVTRAGFARPNWETATYNLIAQDGSQAVVEATFLMGMWHMGHEHASPWEVQRQITFIDGRIDSGGGWPWFPVE